MGGKTSKEKHSAAKDEKSKEDAEAQDLTKNKKWVKQMEGFFDAVDLNKNGYVTIEEILKWSDNMKELCSVTPEESENLQKCLKDFYGAAGLLPGKQVTREEFINGVNHLSAAELEKKKLGEETLIENLCNAFYKAMDINDDGTITLNEVKTIVKACNMGEEKAEKWFSLADKNKNGVVEPHELTKAEFESWFCPEEDNTE